MVPTIIVLVLLFAMGRRHPGEPPPSPKDSPMPEQHTLPATAHFQLSEWDDPNDGTPPQEYWGNIQMVMEALEVVRSYFGGAPITITGAGGWRSVATNASNPGRSKNSTHLTGRAADIIVKGVPPSDVYAAIDELQAQGQIPRGGAHAYKYFTHVDIRGWMARW